MAELSEENLDLELRRSADGEEGKPTPANKLRPVPNLTSWTMDHYARIVIRAYPDKAGAAWSRRGTSLESGDLLLTCHSLEGVVSMMV